MKMSMAFVFLSVALSSCAQTPVSPKIYDGKWWASTSKEQRVGFLSGYADCSINDVGDKRWSHFSAINEEPKVSKYFADHASDMSLEVETVLWKLWPESKQTKPAPNGDTYRDKHGFFDGDYWRQADASHRLGFIQGYLFCQKKHSKPAATFSSTPEWYVVRISNWYGLKANDPDEIDEKKVDQKIANVLYLLRDRSRMNAPSRPTNHP